MRRGALLLAVAAAGLAGCGFGAGKEDGRAVITVTRDFGHVKMGAVTPTVRSSDTVMRALQREFKVRTRFGGGFVQAIDGKAGGHEAGRPIDWFYYVNGIEASKGAASTKLHRGDRVRWDLHRWGAAQAVPAIVASFPEPFLHGKGGERYPTRLECAPGAGAACGEVERRLDDQGVVTGRSAFGTAITGDVIRVVVGPWKAVRGDEAAQPMERGPRVSGVFVKPAKDGGTFTLLDENGGTVSRLGAGTGLVAAVRRPRQAPTWVVTGTDAAGVGQAAQALTVRQLEDKWAAVVADGTVTGAPGRPR
jgi:Domain of unknown function (DUF4430)